MTLPVGSVTGFLRLLGGAEFESGVMGAQRSMNLAAGSAMKMAGAVDKTDAALARSRSTYTSASAAAAKFRAEQLSATAATERYNAALNSGTASAAKLASAEASMIRANERVSASMRAKAAATEQSQAKMIASVTGAGKKMSKAITLPVVALAAVSVDQAAKFQKSMNTIAVATDQTAASTAAGSKGLQRIALETGQSLSQLSNALYTATKSGMPMAKALAVVEASAKGAAAEGADLGVATQALTSIMASYGKSLGDPVQAENALIRGAGLAKTTYQDFADSLANVVPIASSLHISFAQVAGAVDTMTQHGETAQRATDNLANLITNLAGQNNVASKSLQQLGVNTIDLSKNLGQRGLTGSLNVVLDAIAKHGKDGEVVTSAFKDAATATASLQTELDHLPKSMQANAQAFVKGTMSYKDFYAYTKSLGGAQFAMAKDLITTQRAATGFNSQLTSGNSTVKTLAATLQKSLGGVTGMRTALMLSGNSAKGFKDATNAVAAAAKQSGGDILGWAQTQDTLDNKMKRAKASLQVMAVEIGDELIPAVSKLAQEGTKAAHWVDGLSHTQKEVLAWSVGVLAAMGPVLSIGGRLATVGRGIGSFTATSAAKLATLAGASEVSSLRIATAMRLTTSALTGAGVGLALGEVTKNSSNATKGLSALGAAATGAAIGFGVGGPWGAAIGGAVGGLSDLAIGFFDSGNSAEDSATKQQKAADAAQRVAAQAEAAKQAQLDHAQAVDSLTQAILADNNAIKANTRLQVENDLQKSGAFKTAQQLGIPLKTVTDTALGSLKARRQLEAAEQKIIGAPGLLADGSIKSLGALNLALAKEGVNLHEGAVGADQMAEANGKLNLATRSVAKQYALYGTSLNAATQVGQQNLRFIDSHIAALLSDRSAGKLSAAAFDGQVTALHKQLSAYGYSTTQVTAFTQALRRVPKRVLTQIEKKGVTPAEIQTLINKYSNLPAETLTKVDAKDKASPKLLNVSGLLNALNGKTATPKIGIKDDATARLEAIQRIINGLHGTSLGVNVAVATSGGIGGHHAAGGPISGPGTGTSDSIPAKLSNGEYVVNARAAGQNRAALDAMNYGAQKFAAGGAVSTSTSGGKTSYTFGGIQYSSLQAAQNAQTRAAQSVTKAMNALGHELPKFLAALGQSTSQLHSAEQTLVKDLQNAHATHAQMQLVHADLVQLNAVARERDRIDARLGSAPTAPTAYDRLATARGAYQQTASSVSQAFLSGFNILSAGAPDPNASWVQARQQMGMAIPGQSGASILAALQAQIGTDQKFKGELAKLGKEGLSKSLLSQLAEAGPDQAGATVAALVGASQSQINTLTLKYGQLQKLGNAAGKQTADVVNGKQLKAAQDAVAELKKMERTLDRKLEMLGKKIEQVAPGVGHELKSTGHAAHARARGQVH